MIHVTADTHNDIDFQKVFDHNRGNPDLTREDYLIIAGDFGIPWGGVNKKTDEYLLNWINEHCKFTILFVDGNHCFSNDTEVLTEDGWKNIQELIDYNEKIKIGQFDITTKKISFSYPLRSIKRYVKEDLYDFSSSQNSILVTGGHDLILKEEKIKARDIVSKQYRNNDLILSGIGEQGGIKEEDNWLKLLTWVIMDGTMVDNSKYMPNSKKKRIQFKLSKPRKIEALKNLLNEMDIKFTFAKATKSGINILDPYYIRIYADDAKEIWNRLEGVKQIPLSWRGVNKKQLETILETLSITDGTITGNYIIWNTTSLNDVNILQEACIKNQHSFRFSVSDYKSGFKESLRKRQYHCSIIETEKMKSNYFLYPKNTPYEGYVYCYTMPLGTLITRRNGIVNFVGNCNFDLLNEYPVVEKFGSKVHQLLPNLFHLMRGHIYEIDGYSIFAFGGAESTDKHRRIEGQSWWRQELPSVAEEDLGLVNLEKVGYKVDIVLTHDSPFQMLDSYHQEDNSIRKYFFHLNNIISYKLWIFGHHHVDRDYYNEDSGARASCLYDRVIDIENLLKK